MFDVLIKNGIIIDGSGGYPFRGDVGISGNKIKKIGELHNERGEVEIDAEWRIVSPGFIDVNNHSDTYWRIFLDNSLKSLVRQGITTIIGGNCGSSLAPLVSLKTIETIQKWTDIKKINVNWITEKEFLAVLEKKDMIINFLTLVGHATLRRGILGDDQRELDRGEMNFLKKILENSLDQGAFGLSSGLIYTHAKSANTNELVEFSKVVAKFGGIYATHIRSERENFLEGIEEAIHISNKSQVKLHISHLKAAGKNNWGKMDEALSLINEAKSKGNDITFDVYPYTNTGSVLYALLPDWATEGGKKAMLMRLENNETRKKIIEEMKKSEIEYEKVEIAISPLNKTLTRRKISEIARSQGKGIEETVVDILVASEGRVVTSIEMLREEDVRKAISHPLSIISTNGAGYDEEHKNSGEQVHPRNFGTFPKVLEKYVLREGILSWEEAIRKMSGFPAEKFGIKNRGALREGNFADVIIIDENRIKSLATTENPYQYSKGIDWVLVNGKIVVQEGKFRNEKNGQVIRRQ